MKCNCETCDGSGQVVCPECSGVGTYNGPIETIELLKTMKNYEELKALQKDARRCIEQVARLKEMNPHRVGTYAEQLIGTLAIINRQAEKLK